MFKLYKPTKNNTGCLLSVGTVAKTDKITDTTMEKGEKAVYFTFVKQSGWDEKNQSGTFKGGKICNVKMSPTEIAGMTYAVRANESIEPAYYHDSADYVTQIYFGPAFKKEQKDGKWIDTDIQKGFALRVIRTNKQNKEDKESFGLGFTFPEVTLFVKVLDNSLNHICDAYYAENIRKPKKVSKDVPDAPEATPEAVAEPVSEAPAPPPTDDFF